MSDPVASVATAASAQVLLERSPQTSRTIAALRYTLDAMRSERAEGAEAAKLSSEALTFAEEIRRQDARAAPPLTAGEVNLAPPGRATPITPPAAPVAALTVPEWQPSDAALAAAAPAADAPLDIMQWKRGAGTDEPTPVTFDEAAPVGVTAPDIARLAEVEQNQIPRDVLEIMRERHLGPVTAQPLTGRSNER